MKRIKQRRRLVIDRDDHIGDSLGPVFLDQSARNQDEIFARLADYLGPRVRIIKAELSDERVEIEIELQAHVEESSRLAAAASDLGRKGARRNALAMFREALELDPLNRDAATGMGLLLAELEQYPEALMILRRARESGAEDADLLYTLGRVCLRLRRTPSAVRYLERACELAPRHFGARRALAELGRKPNAAVRQNQPPGPQPIATPTRKQR